MKKVIVYLVLVTAILHFSCAFFAISTAPSKKQNTTESELAKTANDFFWKTLHGGDYHQIPKAIELLTAAYLENPNHPDLAARTGWLHIWRLAERNRMATIPATITDDMTLCKKYFSEAYKLNQEDARYLGFLGSCTLAEGTIDNDEPTIRKGYFQLKDAIHMWPEFNYFTAGFVLSQLPHDSPQFKEALEMQWKNYNLCVGETVDRSNPDVQKYMNLETKEGNKRACWNSWIAPHNVEGFFLNMGDMLVKNGDPETAVKIYLNVKKSKQYKDWKFTQILESRIKNAESNVTHFRKIPLQQQAPNYPTMMINSPFSCVGCHQK